MVNKKIKTELKNPDEMIDEELFEFVKHNNGQTKKQVLGTRSEIEDFSLTELKHLISDLETFAKENNVEEEKVELHFETWYDTLAIYAYPICNEVDCTKEELSKQAVRIYKSKIAQNKRNTKDKIAKEEKELKEYERLRKKFEKS